MKHKVQEPLPSPPRKGRELYTKTTPSQTGRCCYILLPPLRGGLGRGFVLLHNLGGGVALTTDEETVGGVFNAHTLEVVVNNGCVVGSYVVNR